MGYKNLKKLYFQNKDLYEEEYKSRIASPYALHLDFQICDSPAFIMEVSEVLSPIIHLQRLNREIESVCQELPGIAVTHFSKRCLIDEIVLTNSIEGVNSTRREIKEILDEFGKKDTQKRFYGLVNKYRMLQNKEALSLSTCEDIRNIYNELVLQEVIEEDKNDFPDGRIFRKDSVTVYNSAGKEIHQGIYPEDKLIKTMEQALCFLADDGYDVFIRIAGFHYLIGYIHPFYNGNGRLSRFISSYLLAQELHPLVGYRLSYTIKKNISDYYAAFEECNDFRNKGDLTPFVIMFLDVLTQALEQLLKALTERKIELYRYLQNVGESVLGVKSKELLSYLVQASLFSELGISTLELLDVLGISRATLHNRLNSLKSISDQLVISQRDGKEKYYRANLKEVENLFQSTPPRGW